MYIQKSLFLFSCLSCWLQGFLFPSSALLLVQFVWPQLGSDHTLTGLLITTRGDEHTECLQPVQELSSTWREQFIFYGSHLELNANLSVPTAPLTLKCMANLFRAFRRVCAINLNSLLKHGQLLRSQWIPVKFAPPPLIAFTKGKKIILPLEPWRVQREKPCTTAACTSEQHYYGLLGYSDTTVLLC